MLYGISMRVGAESPTLVLLLSAVLACLGGRAQLVRTYACRRILDGPTFCLLLSLVPPVCKPAELPFLGSRGGLQGGEGVLWSVLLVLMGSTIGISAC
jgi:hypothetical protein